MKIAMLSWESLHSVTVGGAAVAVTELAAALERSGNEVHVFTRLVPGQRFYERVYGVHYHRCPYPPHPDFVDDVNNMCRALVERLFVVEDMTGPFDIVHAHDWLAANAMIWIKQGRGRTSVFQVHSTEYARCGNAFPGGRSTRVRDQERAGTYWADRVICVSNTTKKEVMWMYEVPEAKTAILFNGVNASRFRLDVDPGGVKRSLSLGPVDPTVLYCGRLEWQKGPDLLVEAIPRVMGAHPQARFVFAGDGGMRGDLERRVRELGVAHAVRFVGVRSGDALVELFKMCDMVCIPSRNEPFGIVVLEAWSAGKPVVVTENGGPSEFVRHDFNGLRIHPEAGSIAWGITRLMEDCEHARWMGQNGYDTVGEQFSWDAIAVQAMDIYMPLVASSARSAPAHSGSFVDSFSELQKYLHGRERKRRRRKPKAPDDVKDSTDERALA